MAGATHTTKQTAAKQQRAEQPTTSSDAAAATAIEGRGDGSVPARVEEVAEAVGDSARGPLAIFPALALGLFAVAVAVPAVRPRGVLAARQAEIAGLGVSCLVAWAVVALL